MNNSFHDMNVVLSLLENAGVKASLSMDREHSRALTLFTFTNTDGSLRWLWPADSRSAAFLRFYNASSVKAKFFAAIAGTAAQLGLSGLLSRRTVRLFIHEDSVNRLERWGTDFAIFTGTTGPNRKGVIATGGKDGPAFIKSSLTDASSALIHQEAAWLKELALLSLEKMKVPALLQLSAESAIMEDICTTDSFRSNELLPQHYLALAELQVKTTTVVSLSTLPVWEKGMKQLERLKATTDSRLPKGLIRKLSLLAEHLNTVNELPCSLAHGDFTPWNMYVRKESLSVYDWELAIEKAPLLWDAYHFILQSAILVGRKPATAISESIQHFENSGWVKNLIAQYGICPRQQRMFYLLLNTLYYTELYSRQPQWHTQVGWLLQSWSALLSEAMASEGLLSQRELLSIDLFDHLQGKDYATLKWISPLPEALPAGSDFDLCVSKAVSEDAQQFLEEHLFAGKVLAHQKTYMDALTILLKDGSLLSVDLIHQFKRRAVEMMSATEVLKQRTTLPSGIQVPAPFHQFSYTWLFYILNGASVPEKYSVQYQKQEAGFYQDFKNHWGIDLREEATHYQKDKHRIAMEQIMKEPANKGWNRIRNIYNDYADRAGELFRQKGMVITFSGVDGAGKSTVIENVKQHIDKKMRRKVVVLRHRPSVLPILSAWKHGKAAAEQKAAITLPRQGNNRNTASSFLRFAYYYADYFFGQFYIQCKYVWRGYVVLYDRYYFDFINDSRRSNIQLSPAFTSMGYKLLLKPDYNFFLYAQPEEILRRKQELDADTIRELTGKYLNLFNGLSQQYQRSRYIPIHNQELDLTLNTIFQQIEKRA